MIASKGYTDRDIVCLTFTEAINYDCKALQKKFENLLLDMSCQLTTIFLYFIDKYRLMIEMFSDKGVLQKGELLQGEHDALHPRINGKRFTWVCMARN